MRSRRAVCTLLLTICGASTAIGLVDEPPRPSATLRTTEIIRRDCGTTIHHQQLTLFANGTLRLRQRSGVEEDLELAELRPEELEAFKRRLGDEDLSEVGPGRAEVQGDWIEQCTLRLHLADRSPREFHFGRFDSLPLALARLNRVVDDMVQVVEERAPVSGLPRHYVPRSGDILVRPDGAKFEVIAFTSDGLGVELSGVDQPLTLFVAVDALGEMFVEMVDRREWP